MSALDPVQINLSHPSKWLILFYALNLYRGMFMTEVVDG